MSGLGFFPIEYIYKNNIINKRIAEHCSTLAEMCYTWSQDQGILKVLMGTDKLGILWETVGKEVNRLHEIKLKQK